MRTGYSISGWNNYCGMTWVHITYVISIIITLSVMSLLSLYSWRKRTDVSGSIIYILIAVLICLVCIFEILMMLSSSADTGLFWFKMRFLPLSLIPPFWIMVLFIITFTGGMGAFIGLLWKRQIEKFYRERYESAEALSARESSYRELVQNANSAILRWNSNGKISFFNEYAQNLFGYSADEILGKDVSILVPETDSTGADLTTLVNDIVKNPDKYVNNVNENICRDGRRLWMMWTNKPVFNENRKFFEILAVGSDITQLKKTEERLQISEKRYRSLFENMLNGLAFCKMIYEDDIPADFIYLEVNNSFSNLTGLSDVAGKKVTDVVPGIRESDPVLFETYGRVALTGIPETFETFVEALNMWFSVSVYSPEREYFVAVFDVITDKKNAEIALKESEERFRSIVEGAPDPIFIQIEGKFVYVNSAALRLFGADKEEYLIGKPVIERFHPDFHKKIMERIQILNVDRKSVNQLMEFKFLKMDSSEVWVETAGEPIVYNGKNGALVFVRNIDERKLAIESLEKSEKRFRTTMDNMMEGSQIIGHDWKYIYINKAAEKHNQRPNEELIGRKYQDMWPGIEATKVYETISRCMTERVSDQFENEFTFPDGTVRWFDLSIQPVPEGVFILSIDITDRKHIEVSLKKSEDLFSKAFHSSPAPMTIALQSDGRYIEVNKSFLNLIEADREETIGHTGAELNLIDEEARSAILKLVHEKKAIYNVEVKARTKTGRLLNLMTSIENIELGGKTCTIATMLDISERIRAEEELKRSEERFRTTLDNMMEGGQIISHDWTYLYINKAAEKQNKRLSTELIGNKMTEAWPGLQYTRVYEVIRFSMENREKQHVDIEFIFPDCSKGWFELSIQPIPEGIFILSIDITDRIRTEREKRLFIEELERSNKELQQFAYVASHDLQEPLRMISSYLQLIERRYKDKLDQDANDFINFAVDGASRLQSLIIGLLEFSRVRTHGKPFSEVNIGKILDNVLGNLELQIHETGAAVNYENMPVISADETQISRLFQNLIQNSLKFRREEIKPHVSITVEKNSEEYIFCVRDNGIGIEPQYYDRIFTIFQRLHAREEYPGTGIGLAICKRIVERHGGKIWLESVPGEGSSFYFTIPGGL